MVRFPINQQTARGKVKLVLNKNEDIAERFRVSRTQFDELLGRIGMDLEPITQRSQAMSDENKLLIALCFYATGSFCWEIGDVQGLSKSPVSAPSSKSNESTIIPTCSFDGQRTDEIWQIASMHLLGSFKIIYCTTLLGKKCISKWGRFFYFYPFTRRFSTNRIENIP